MEFVRSQAMAALMVLMLGTSLSRVDASEVVSAIKGAGIRLCSNRSRGSTCFQGPGLDSFAIYGLGFTFQIGTDLWAPESTLDRCTEQTTTDIASKNVHALAWGLARENLQPTTSGPVAWVKEITCNIMQYEVATFSADHEVTGVYNATVSQSCQFRIQNYVSEQYGDDQWWYPFRPGYDKYSPIDMTQNRSFTAKEGYQIVGVQMEFGAGNLTKIPFGIIESPAPSAPNSSKPFLRR